MITVYNTRHEGMESALNRGWGGGREEKANSRRIHPLSSADELMDYAAPTRRYIDLRAAIRLHARPRTERPLLMFVER